MSVYFATCREMGVVKIGVSVEPHGRCRELQTSCPRAVKLEAIMPGSFDEEGDLHFRFAHARLKGEWFTITPEIEALIEANPAGPAPSVNAVRRTKPRRPPIRYGETAREYEQRLIDERRAVERAAAIRWLEQQAVEGHISFPFRELAELEDE